RYLLEIRDTRFFTGSKKHNAITMVKNVKSKDPSYQLTCEHDHSYKVRISALSPSGVPSPYSEESALLICDQKKPLIIMDPLPSPTKLRYPSLAIAGTYKEPNLESMTINGNPVFTHALSGRFSASIELDPGANTLTLNARDLAGNITEKQIQVDYAPLTIVSLPPGASIYWNGNYAYLGIYSDTTPQSFNQAVQGEQVLRLTYPGFNDYYGTIDFSDLTTDTYTITLTPFSGNDFSQVEHIVSNQDNITIDSFSYPFVVDYDMDGKKDLLIGTKEGTVALFINRKSDNKPEFSDYVFLHAEEKTIDVGTHAAPFIIDYNNDGTKDLLVGNGDGALIYFENTGSNSKPIFASPISLHDTQGEKIAVGSNCKPFVTDWNSDNKKDLLLGSGD
ncbi:MAG: FG-GAP-like repeat-containing protein, partial [Thermodesulfobacteriota bacterium]|nr:FG-GAP-like repeat-containing protein [Thermodesulfobacteriota bacterium]